jgi:hypothetical protein
MDLIRVWIGAFRKKGKRDPLPGFSTAIPHPPCSSRLRGSRGLQNGIDQSCDFPVADGSISITGNNLHRLKKRKVLIRS